MDLHFLRFYELFRVWVVVRLYGFSSLFTGARSKGKSRYGSLNFQDRFDNLLEKWLSGVAEQGDTVYMGDPSIIT